MPHCWGLCLENGRMSHDSMSTLWASGTRLRTTDVAGQDVLDRAIRVELDRPGRSLRFILESSEGLVEIGSIRDDFDCFEDLVFTVCACCSPTRYSILEMQI